MKKLKVLLSSTFLVVLLALPVAALYHQQSIKDWYRLRDYVPSARIAQLADNTHMTEYGRKLWYVNHPELLDKNGFTEKCDVGEKTIVLGCYISDQRIYLFDVMDERLAGIHEVTAAHEMLHAGYERLSSSERNSIDTELDRVFRTVQDKRIQDTVQSYKDRDPSVVTNELHSILATEVRELSPELENYYKRYFTDRPIVVDIATKYEEEFGIRQRRVAELQAEMEKLKSAIDAEKALLANQEGVINAAKGELDALVTAKRIEEYNAQVPLYNQKVNTYNAIIVRLQNLITQFNSKVEEHNAIAEEQKSLIDAIDSRPSAQPAE